MTLYRVRDVDIAASIATSTGAEPDVVLAERGMVDFVFQATPEVLTAVARYASESLSLDAKRLLATRQRLFRKIRGVRS